MHYKSNPRVQFIIPDSYFCFLDVYGLTLRFHHGHAIRYQGGVGGLTIPLNKAIAQWNKAKHADIDFAGHWHQMFDNGNAIMNGSMIGYNAYAVRIKAGFERPSQSFIVLNSKWETKVCVRPILFS